MFGYLPGSWTGGASKGRQGLIEAAHGGTLFLDEIGDMPLSLQAKLLRVLSESQITPVGARAPRAVDIRVVSASHRGLADSVQRGEFRQDLLYRLNAAELHLPPLRQRQDLAAMLDRLLAELGPYRLDEAARTALLAHRWPGNLRELNNALRYATALCDTPDADGQALIDLAHLPDALQTASTQSPPLTVDSSNRQTTGRWVGNASAQDGDALAQLLAQCQGNVSEVARLLGVNRSTVHRRIQRMLGQRQVRWDGRE